MGPLKRCHHLLSLFLHSHPLLWRIIHLVRGSSKGWRPHNPLFWRGSFDVDCDAYFLSLPVPFPFSSIPIHHSVKRCELYCVSLPEFEILQIFNTSSAWLCKSCFLSIEKEIISCIQYIQKQATNISADIWLCVHMIRQKKMYTTTLL